MSTADSTPREHRIGGSHPVPDAGVAAVLAPFPPCHGCGSYGMPADMVTSGYLPTYWCLACAEIKWQGQFSAESRAAIIALRFDPKSRSYWGDPA